MKSFPDDYVTDYDVTWPVFSVKNRTVVQPNSLDRGYLVQLPLAASHSPLGCRAFIPLTNNYHSIPLQAYDITSISTMYRYMHQQNHLRSKIKLILSINGHKQ